MPLIETGQPAPPFALLDANGKRRALTDFRGRALVLYFYPEDDTPLCTTEACHFRDRHAALRALDAEVVGISPDSPSSHGAFTAKYALPFTLLADERDSNGVPKVCELYGVWREKSMYGKRVVGMVRTTYLIDRHGVVVKRWDSVKTPTHGDRVLQAVEALTRESGKPAPTAGRSMKQRP